MENKSFYSAIRKMPDTTPEFSLREKWTRPIIWAQQFHRPAYNIWRVFGRKSAKHSKFLQIQVPYVIAVCRGVNRLHLQNKQSKKM